jgi:PAS domain S-box-containing protein
MELAAAQTAIELDTLLDQQRELEESRSHYADLFDFAPVGYLALDRNGCIRAVNVTGAQLLGQKREALVGRPLLPFVARRDRRKYLGHLAKLRRGEAHVTTELHLELKGQPPIPIQLISIRDFRQNFRVQFPSALVDLTERKRAEQTLRESEARFRHLADSAPVLIWMAGPDKLCNYFNRRWLEFTGRTFEQEVGNGRAAGVHAEDLPRWLETYETAFDARREFQIEYRLRRHDREYRWIMDHGIPRFASAGEFLGYIGSCVDLTDRRRSEAALLEKDAELQLITDITPVMLTRCGRDLRYQFVNRAYAEFVGLAPGQILGARLAEVMGEAAFHFVRPYVETVLGGQPVEYEVELSDARTGRHFLHVSYAPERDAHGAVVGWVAGMTDITERKRAEALLQVRDAISSVLARAVTLQEASGDIIQALCEMSDWEAGAIWIVGPAVREMWCVDFWRKPGVGVPNFEALTRARTFAPGIGLPGRVWQSGEPVWLADVTNAENFPRGRAALEDGLHAGFCFPIKIGDEVLGAFECFSRRTREPDPGLITMLTSIGQQLGQFVERTQAEAALRQSEERLRHILESALDAVVTMDHDGIIRLWNPQAENTFGWTAAEALGKKLSDLIVPPAYRARHEAGLRHYLNTGVGLPVDQRIELTALHRSGSEFPVELSITPVALEDHISFSAFIRDITRRKQAEAALRESEDRFRTLANHAPVGSFMSGINGDALYVTDSWCQMTDLTPEAALGQGWLQAVHPDDREAILRGWNAAVSQGDSSLAEYRFLRRDGSVVWVQGNAARLRDPAGHHTGYVGTVANITARKLAEETLVRARDELEARVRERTSELTQANQALLANEKALRESEERLQAILDNSPSMIFLKDVAGRYLHANRRFAAVTRLPLAKTAGKTDADLFPPEQAAAFHAHDQAVADAGHPIQYDAVTLDAEGVHTSIVSKFPLFDADGKIYAVGGIATDITERKRLEAEILKISEREQRRIAQDLHDGLGQQLAGISCLTNALKTDLLARGAPDAATAERISRLLDATVAQTRGLARGLHPVEPEPGGLLAALDQLAANISELFKVSCKFQCRQPVLIHLNAVATHLYRIAQESANNAIKHGRAGRIVIQLSTTAEKLTLKVRDNGVGFSEAVGNQKGLGLRIMKYRAGIIGGTLAIQRRTHGGTEVTCVVPTEPPVHSTD